MPIEYIDDDTLEKRYKCSICEYTYADFKCAKECEEKCEFMVKCYMEVNAD